MSVLSPKRVVFWAVATAFLAVNAFAVNPSPRDHARMVFVPTVGEAILFGGTSAFDRGTATAYDSNETWAWTGTRWTQRFPAHTPPARSAQAMSYDSLRDRIMMFGGRYQTGTGANRKLNLLGDTWVYENGDWRELALDPAPSARQLSAMAYDPIRDRTILYGGSVFAADGVTTEIKADTWEFDGTRWTQVNDGQVKVGNPLLAYDGARDQMILLGTDTEFKPHMYRYDPSAKSWTEITPEKEKMADCVNDAALVYAPSLGSLLLVGGVCTILDSSTAKTWQWDGTAWSEIKTVTAVARTTGSAMAFDTLRETAILYGGTEHLDPNPRSVTLLFNRGNWRFAVLHTRPSPRSLFGFTTDPARNTVWLLGGVGEYNNIYAADLWGYRDGQWFVKNAKTPPPSCVGVASAYDKDREKLVYVCWPETGLDMEVYEFDGKEFKNVSAKNKPDARRFAALVYDENLKKTVFFGGFDIDQNYKDDTWTWDGTNWTEVRRDRPPNRGMHAMWYDPLQKRTILYGGVGREDVEEHVKRFSDMWAFNGNGWTKIPVTTTPGERLGPQYAVDPNTGKVLLFGGLVHALRDPKNERSGHQFYDNETWQWDGASSTWTKLSPTTSPSARQNGRLAYDPVAQRLVLFGGFAGFFFSDLWSWTGTTWEVRPENGARRRPNAPGPVPQPPTGSDMF